MHLLGSFTTHLGYPVVIVLPDQAEAQMVRNLWNPGELLLESKY